MVLALVVAVAWEDESAQLAFFVFTISSLSVCSFGYLIYGIIKNCSLTIFNSILGTCIVMVLRNSSNRTSNGTILSLKVTKNATPKLIFSQIITFIILFSIFGITGCICYSAGALGGILGSFLSQFILAFLLLFTFLILFFRRVEKKEVMGAQCNKASTSQIALTAPTPR